MARKHSQPALRHHRPSGRAVVTIDGKDIYLGPHGSPEAHEAYARKIAEWRLRQRELAAAPGILPQTLSVNGAILAYLEHAEKYYVDADGSPNHEFREMKAALAHVKALYDTSRAADFGPRALKTVRQHLIDKGMSRGVVNQRVNRIKRAWKWLVSEELVPAGAYEALRSVAGLRFGRTTARETEPVKPADEHSVMAVLELVSPPVRAMIKLQRLTGMRPNEVCQMRPCDIDRSGSVWIYQPARHKNRWRGHSRLVQLGPRAQQILQPFLNRPEDAFLFSPAEAESWNRRQRTVHTNPERTTPIYPSEWRARAKRMRERAEARARRKRPPGEKYSVDSYRRCIAYAIQRARRGDKTVQWWAPNQLRHTRATELRKLYGIEGAQVALGHAKADVTQVYAERDLALATRIAAEVG